MTSQSGGMSVLLRKTREFMQHHKRSGQNWEQIRKQVMPITETIVKLGTDAKTPVSTPAEKKIF